MRRRLAVEVKGQKSALLMNDEHNVSQAVAGLQLPPVHKISKPFEPLLPGLPGYLLRYA